MGENSVTPPSKGDPITAAWAARLTAAANAAQYGSADPDTLCTPFGVTAALHPPREMDAPPALPAPFTVRLLDDGATPNALHAWVYVPTGDAEFVYLGATPCAPALSATNNGTGWFDLGAVPADGNARHIVLAFNATGAKPTFDIALQSSRRMVPSGCCPGLPVVALARVTIPTAAASGEDEDDPATSSQMLALSSDSGALGLVQLREGALVLPDYGTQSLDCALGWVDDGNGGEEMHLFAFLPDANAVRVNGVAATLDASGLTAVTGWSDWYDLGAVSSSTAAWLVFDIASGADYAAMTNAASPYATATIAKASASSPPTPANIGNRPRLAPPVMIWRAVGAWYTTEPSGVQLVRSSVNLPLAVTDTANTRDDGKLFASVDWGTKGQTQLRGFESPTPKTGAQVVAASASLPVRFPRADGGAEVYYVDAADVALNDGGNLLFNGDTYAPTSITINGVAYTLLVKQ